MHHPFGAQITHLIKPYPQLYHRKVFKLSLFKMPYTSEVVIYAENEKGYRNV